MSGENSDPGEGAVEVTLEDRIREAVRNPRNLGEMKDSDAVGTVGSPECGDMLRMWVKFRDESGRKVIDRATFQSFGCETAIAVASVATELISGKSVEEALALSGSDLSAPLGALPPMKIHCAQMVEGALRSALTPEAAVATVAQAPTGNLIEGLQAPKSGSVRVVLKTLGAKDG